MEQEGSQFKVIVIKEKDCLIRPKQTEEGEVWDLPGAGVGQIEGG